MVPVLLSICPAQTRHGSREQSMAQGLQCTCFSPKAAHSFQAPPTGRNAEGTLASGIMKSKPLKPQDRR